MKGNKSTKAQEVAALEAIVVDKTCLALIDRVVAPAYAIRGVQDLRYSNQRPSLI
jgi:hypothetical protein